MNTRSITVTLFLAFLLLILSGCDRSSSGNDTEEMVLYHALPARITGLDSGDQRDAVSILVKSQMFEPLYQYHFLSGPRQ